MSLQFVGAFPDIIIGKDEDLIIAYRKVKTTTFLMTHSRTSSSKWTNIRGVNTQADIMRILSTHNRSAEREAGGREHASFC